MQRELLLGEMDFLMGLCISKCGRISAAEDLAQETLLSALLYLEKGGTFREPRAFLASVANRKYADMLRRKYRRPTVYMGPDADIACEDEGMDEILRSDEAQSVRKEVAHLGESYRKVIVGHYFHGKSVKDLSRELCIPEGTVKSRLDAGRKLIRKGLEEMKNYTENSYAPKALAVRNSGRCGLNGEPMNLTEDSILAQNLLILAYEKPVTVAELSRAIGVSAAYVEPEVNKLVSGELMKRTGDGKVYTDFIIYDALDFVKYVHEAEAFTDKYISAYTEPVEKAIALLKTRPYYSLRLERFMMINVAQNGLYSSIEACREKPQVFPERPNGGSWIAFATVYPENFKIPEELQGREEYGMSGRRCTVLDNYLGNGKLKLYNFETSLDPAGWKKHTGFGYSNFMELEQDMLKTFYVVKKGIAPETVDLDTRMISGLSLLEERGFISLSWDKPELLVPVLNGAEEREFFDICRGAAESFGEKIREPLAEYCRTHVKPIPPHLDSVPDQKRTMPYEPDTMMFVYGAIARGIHPRDIGPAPETVVVFD